MSRLHLHRWAVIFLLMSKLILGEFAHAMPHLAQEMETSPMALHAMVMPAAADADSPPCGNHVQAETQPSQDSANDPDTKHCCKGGECACPCLHSPAAATVIPSVVQLTHGEQVATRVLGAARPRLSGLFRPPA